jgi:hypothetical protein
MFLGKKYATIRGVRSKTFIEGLRVSARRVSPSIMDPGGESMRKRSEAVPSRFVDV